MDTTPNPTRELSRVEAAPIPGLPYNGSIRQLDSRTRRRCLALIESALRRGAEHFFQKHGFVNVIPPHIVPITGACENVDTLFDFEYFGKEAFLNQTGQTALELFVATLGKVCCEIKSFRKEPEADCRHLTEFPLLELEFAYGQDEDGFELLMENVEGCLKSMFRNALNRARASLEEIGADVDLLERMVAQPFARIGYDEAIEVLGKTWGDDLDSLDEARLVAHCGNLPTFTMRYPEAIKFFNMKWDRDYQHPTTPGNPRRVLSFDLLLPYAGESVGAAVREEDYEVLVQKLQESPMFRILSERGKGLEDFAEYLDEVRHHPTPHAGCGIGLYRVLQCVTQTDDIRLASTYLLNSESKMGFSA